MKRFLAFCLTAGATALFAQEANQGTITGFVFDQSQAVVAGAEIRVISQATGQTREAKSDGAGVYTVVALQPGVYTVRASANGFKPTGLSNANSPSRTGFPCMTPESSSASPSGNRP